MNKEENKTIISNIRYLRKEKGLTQKQLASKVGLSQSMLGAYEEYRALPTICNFHKLSLFFGISMEDMLTIDLSKK